MPAEIDTMQLLEHLDGKFAEADRKRSDGLTAVHAKIEAHIRESRENLDGFRHETTAALGALALKAGNHETRIEAIEKAGSKASDRAFDSWKTGAVILFGGGGFAAFLRWLEGKN